MLVRFAIDSEGLPAGERFVAASERVSHRELLDFLRSHGWLVLAGTKDRDELVGRILALPASLRQPWTVTLPRLPLTSAPPGSRPLADLASCQELRAEWSGHIHLGLVRAELAVACGLPEDQAAIVDDPSAIEISRVESALGAAHVQRLRSTRTREIATGAARTAVWQERFAPLVSVSREIIIVDRYAGVNELRRRRGRMTGLEWALKEVDAAARATVHVLVQADDLSQGQAIKRAVQGARSRLSGGGVRAFELTVASRTVFRDFAHPRHVRFGPSYALTLDRGLEMFADAAIGQGTPCLYGDVDAARAREDNVISRSFPALRRITL